MPTFERFVVCQPWTIAFQVVDRVQPRSRHFRPRVSGPNEPVSPGAVPEDPLEFIDRLDQVPDVLAGILQIPRDFSDCRYRLLGQTVSLFLPQVRRRGPCGLLLRHDPILSDECLPDIASRIFSRTVDHDPAGSAKSLSKGRWPLAISIRRPLFMSATCPTRPALGPRPAGWDDRDGPLPRPLRSRSARARTAAPPRTGRGLGPRCRFRGPCRGGVRESPQPPRSPGTNRPIRGLCEGLRRRR